MATRSLIVLVTARSVRILQYWNVVLSSRFLVSKIKEQNLFVCFVECCKDVPLGCYFILIWQRKQVCASAAVVRNSGQIRATSEEVRGTLNELEMAHSFRFDLINTWLVRGTRNEPEITDLRSTFMALNIYNLKWWTTGALSSILDCLSLSMYIIQGIG